jgi:hypothetical protein
MLIAVGTTSTRVWRVEFLDPNGDFNSYEVSAHNALITEGGVLFFRDLDGNVTRAVNPSGWTEVTPA